MTDTENLTQTISNSLDNPDQRKVTASLIDRYGLTLNVDNLTPEGVAVRDHANRSIGITYGLIRGIFVHSGVPYADIMVIGTKDGILLGWIQADKMTDANDRYLVSVKALNPMPSTFNFAQPCPHMSVYGGYLDNVEKNWRCFGCDKVIPYIG